MTFNSDTVVEECFGADDSVPKVSYNLVPLSQISSMESNAIVGECCCCTLWVKNEVHLPLTIPDAFIDVAGVCRDVGDVFQFTAKASGRELKKRDVTLVDRSSASVCSPTLSIEWTKNYAISSQVSLTLWGQDAEHFDGAAHPIIFIKGGKINEFGGGKSISLTSGSAMKINPDISEAHQLRGWYDNDGRNQDFNSVSARLINSTSWFTFDIHNAELKHYRTGGSGLTTDWVNFYEAKARNLGASEKPDYFQCKAIVHLVKTNSCVYKSCSKPDCNKKVLDQDNGVYRCEKCQANSPDFKYRILLSVKRNFCWPVVMRILIDRFQTNRQALQTGPLTVGWPYSPIKGKSCWKVRRMRLAMPSITIKTIWKQWSRRSSSKVTFSSFAPKSRISVYDVFPFDFIVRSLSNGRFFHIF